MLRRIAFSFGMIGLAALAAGMAMRASANRPKPTQLPDYGAVAPFVLMNQGGAAVSSRMLQGKVWVGGFIFTRCAGQCPLMMNRMVEIAKALEGVQMVAFSVDPSYDTPDVLKDYAQHYQLDFKRWHLLTDWPDQTTAEAYCPPGQGCLTSTRWLAAESFHLSAADGGSVQEPITHSVRLVLVDAQSRIRGYYDAMESEAVSRLKQHAKQLKN